jgi:hypothetical protein
MQFTHSSKQLLSFALLVLCAFVPVACGQNASTQVSVTSGQAPTTQIAATTVQTATTQVAVTSEQTTTTQVSASPSVALIYNGKVAAEGGPEALAVVAKSLGMEVTYFDTPGELPSLLEGATVCMIGGTEDDLTPLLDEFTPAIRQTLRDWLSAGGDYMGVCGGGYVASNGWEDYKGFVDALDGRVAALAVDLGQGRVAVCGPHPEADATWLDDDPAPVDADNWEPTQDLAVELLQSLARWTRNMWCARTGARPGVG